MQGLSMTDEVAQVRDAILAEIEQADDIAAIEAVRVSALGKKGRITALTKSLGQADPDERRALGQLFNEAKQAVSDALAARKEILENKALEEKLQAERIDVGLPARPRDSGRLHPVSQVTDEIIAIFADMGFAVAEGPDIENDFNNFTALNIPENHPARQMHDTFYLAPNAPDRTPHDETMSPSGDNALQAVTKHPSGDLSPLVLRTHTSPVQIRTMLSEKPPHRIIAPGRTYRCDSDMTHTPMIHQVEGLLIDQRTHFGHLKGCLIDFVHAFFERDDIGVRFRPSFFPFTEPSAEMDIGCDRSGGQLRLGEGDDWLEILGCGMVHPNVLRNVGLDPEIYQGFAFGMGIDRVAMLKYGIPDLRTFFDGDLRWLRHYGFLPLDIPTTYGGLSR